MIKNLSWLKIMNIVKAENIVRLNRLRVKFYSWLVFKYKFLRRTISKLKNIRILISRITNSNFMFGLKNWITIFFAGLNILKKLLNIGLFDLTKSPQTSVFSESTEETVHWLYESKTIRKLWTGSVLILFFLIFIEIFIETKSHFYLDDIFGFNAWFGFLACILLVLIATGLGFFLKRQDNFYERD